MGRTLSRSGVGTLVLFGGLLGLGCSKAEPPRALTRTIALARAPGREHSDGQGERDETREPQWGGSGSASASPS